MSEWPDNLHFVQEYIYISDVTNETHTANETHSLNGIVPREEEERNFNCIYTDIYEKPLKAEYFLVKTMKRIIIDVERIFNIHHVERNIWKLSNMIA